MMRIVGVGIDEIHCQVLMMSMPESNYWLQKTMCRYGWTDVRTWGGLFVTLGRPKLSIVADIDP